MSDERLRQYERRASEDPDNIEARLRLLQERLRIGEFEWSEVVPLVASLPGDNRPREMLGQWLFGEGKPRGEYILAACALDVAEKRDKHRLRRRCQELEKLHIKDWTKDFHSKGRWRWKRGFIEELERPMKELVDHGDLYFALEPIEILKIRDCEDFTPLASKPWLSQLRRLKISHRNPKINKTVEALLGASLGRLKSLNLIDASLSGTAFQSLVQAESLQGLESLVLSGNPLGQEGDRGLRFLENSPMTPRNLYLSRCYLDDRDMDFLANCEVLSKVERLAIGLNEGITEVGFQRLITSKTLSSLRWLDVEECEELDGDILNRLRQRFQTVKS